jgi:small subunit ribosomal protein S6
LRDYELVCVLDGALDDAQIQEMNQRLSGLIESEGGVIENVRTSELRRLAYPIKKKTEGVYVVINFRLPPSSVQPLDRVLRLEEHILRHRIFVSETPPPLAHVREKVAQVEMAEETEALDDTAPPASEEVSQEVDEAAEAAQTKHSAEAAEDEVATTTEPA